MIETTERTNNSIHEARTTLSREVFAALCKYCNETGATRNSALRIALTYFLREKGYLTTEAQE